MAERYLEPVLDSANSFYKKAYIKEKGDLEILVSYCTEVATYNKVTKEANIIGFYSQTTTRHIKDFLYQKGVINSCNSNTKYLYENFTERGRREIQEKLILKEEKKVQREIEKAQRLALKEEAKKLREKRKEELLKELTETYGNTFSKSEIRKMMFIELNSEK